MSNISDIPSFKAIAQAADEAKHRARGVVPGIQERRIASEVQLLIAMFNLASDEARQRFMNWLEEPQETEEAV